eukprot:2973032-Amphidinium_carterae.1
MKAEQNSTRLESRHCSSPYQYLLCSRVGRDRSCTEVPSQLARESLSQYFTISVFILSHHSISAQLRLQGRWHRRAETGYGRFRAGASVRESAKPGSPFRTTLASKFAKWTEDYNNYIRVVRAHCSSNWAISVGRKDACGS